MPVGEFDRREILAKVLPGCATLCLGARLAVASGTGPDESDDQPDTHKFERELDRAPTVRQIWDFRFSRDLIPVLLLLQDHVGQEAFVDMLRKVGTERNTQLGRRLAERLPDTSFNTFVDPFRKGEKQKRRLMQLSMIHQVVEDSTDAFEMKVTECLTANVFREAGAEGVGYALVCHADFALPGAINPRIALQRSKTLMQGHECCNHRYLLIPGSA